MLSVNELLQKRAKVWEGAKAFLDTHKTENGTLSAIDAASYEKMEQEIQDLSAAIDRAKRAEELEATLNQPMNVPILGKPMATPDGKKTNYRATDSYRDAMILAMRTGFRNISNVLHEGDDADGGYLVPEQWEKGIIDVLTEQNIMRSLGTVITTKGLTRLNIAATKPAASWIEENGAIQFSDATFDQMTIDAYKLYVAVKVTEELLYDEAYNLQSYLTAEIGKAVANAEEMAMLTGDGKKKPTGVFHATEGGHIANTISALDSDSIISLIYSLKRPYRKSACFLMNDEHLAKIRLLKDGQGNYLWQPSYVAGEPDRVAGFTVSASQFAPKDAIGFGDFSYYKIGDRGTRSFQILRELYAANGQIAFVSKQRVDGKLTLPEAVQILKIGSGSGTPVTPPSSSEEDGE